MTQPNPYDPPHSVADDTYLAGKARRLLHRRHEPCTLFRLMGSQWRRHLVISVCFGLLTVAAWQMHNVHLAIGLAAFWAGRLLRDIQWYGTMAREWESTRELLDWEKIERLAA